jgi:hypothetical protein
MDKASQEASRASNDVAPSVDARSLMMKIKRSIRRQASGGVQELQVQIELASIRLQGRCTSFYSKQLAQTAAMRLCGDLAVVNDIEVVANLNSPRAD